MKEFEEVYSISGHGFESFFLGLVGATEGKSSYDGEVDQVPGPCSLVGVVTVNLKEMTVLMLTNLARQVTDDALSKKLARSEYDRRVYISVFGELYHRLFTARRYGS